MVFDKYLFKPYNNRRIASYRYEIYITSHKEVEKGLNSDIDVPEFESAVGGVPKVQSPKNGEEHILETIGDGEDAEGHGRHEDEDGAAREDIDHRMQQTSSISYQSPLKLNNDLHENGNLSIGSITDRQIVSP